MSDASQQKRESSEERQQALRNKCLNERRRRDKENTYFEELAELISASITDMSSFSVKPEKCAILQESLNQIKQIKEETGSSEAVQQSQVSSSKPSVTLANDVLGPLLLEALDGFLFVVNSQGKVEFVSENVGHYLKYTQEDLVGKSIYNIIHVGDHAQFSGSLLPMSFGSVISWPNETVAKGRTFNCRMLVKPPCEDSDDVEVKQTCVSQYENMQISALQHTGEKFNENSDVGQSCLVCIARRLTITEKTNTMLGIEQFTTKQDINGKILAFDTSGIAPGTYSCPDFSGQNIQEFCHVNDVQNLSKHFQEVLKTGSNTSSVYRFKFQDNRYVFVQTKSKIFRGIDSSDQDFVLSTHSIIRECDSENELKGSASTSLMKSIIGQSQVAGPRNNQNLSGISTQMAAVETLNNSFSQNAVNPSMGLSDYQDVLNSNSSWDLLPSDFEAVIGSSGMNSSNSSSVSSINSWSDMNTMKSSQQQQQQQQLLNRAMLAISKNIRPDMLKFQQRTSSFDSSSNGGQKSPKFSPSPSPRSAPFQVPSQRGMMGYPSQRSPGSSMMSNRMSPGMGYPPQRTPPLSSPVGMNQPGWNRMSQSMHQQHDFPSPNSMTPLSLSMMSPGQQSGMMGRNSANPTPSPRGSTEFLFPTPSPQPSSTKRQVRGAGKLTELLSSTSPRVDSEHSDSRSVLSPLDQSPQPGPGSLSPTEKPQSTTSHDDLDSREEGQTWRNQKNVILKQLLSQEENSDDSEKEDKPDGMNEAEAKKPPVLLKQLLSDPSGTKEKRERLKDKGVQNGELLQFLLVDDNPCTTSAPAESTSQDSDQSSRQRHQSAPDEPQSTTSTPTSKQQTFPPSLRQRHASVEQGFNRQPLSVSSDSGVYKSTESFKRSTDSILADKQLDTFLTSLWEKGNDINQVNPQKKRKLSSEVDSTGDQETGGKEGTKLMRENALLAKLLSTKTKKENIVNTGISGNANPSATPQSRLTKDVTQRLLSVKPNSQQVKDNKSDLVPTSTASNLFHLGGNKDMGQLKNINKNLSQNKSSDLLNSFTSSTNQIEDSNQDNFDTLQMLFNSQTESSMEISEVSESTDPLLNEILQQAEDLKQDLNGPQTPSSSTGNGGQQDNPNVLSDLDLLSQFEHVLSEKNASLEEIDQLLGICTKTSVAGKPSNDVMAIEEIQKELMRDNPIHTSIPNQMMMSRTLQSQAMNSQRGNFMQGMGGIHGNGNMDLGYSVQQISPPNPQGYQQQQPPNFGLPGPRPPGPQGPMSALNNGIPRTGFPNSMAMQVRQSLLQQQKMKQQREMQKRMQAQEQARRRAQMQAQLSNNFGQRFSSSMDGNSMQVQPFPENLAELMNSGNAPNVTLQRNQSIPGPMSPRFNPSMMSQSQGMSQPMMGPSTPNSQMSPHFNQQSQWNIRQQGLTSPLGMSQQSPQLNMQRHRSLSGGTNGQSRFQFPGDGQFNSNVNGSMGQVNMQQQYNRMMRQMSMPGRGSPRTSQSPFGNSPDPMLMSPSSIDISPNNSLRQPPSSQISPPYNQPMGPMSSLSPVSSMNPGINSMASSSNGFNDFDLLDMDSSKMSMNKSDFVKQELRNICNARSEKQMQQMNQHHSSQSLTLPSPGQPLTSPHSQTSVSQQQSMKTLPPYPQQQTSSMQPHYESEIPLDILDTITEMAKEHGVMTGTMAGSFDLEDLKEEDVLKRKREEAKQVYEKFQALAKNGSIESQVEEQDEVIPSTVFRKQLMNPGSNNNQLLQRSTSIDTQNVQVVSKEPRTNVDDIKPPDHKNSLLQKLLSE